MAHLLSNPLFDNDDFIKEKKVVKEEILRYKDIPNENLYRECILKYYKNSNLKNAPIGCEKSLEKIKINDVISWYKNNYTSQNLTISFAGNITFSKAEKLIDKYIVLKNQKPKIKLKPYQTNSHKLKNNFINIVKPINQSLIKIMYEAPNSYSSNYFKFIMLAKVLGCGTSSLLYKHLRDKLGLAYMVNVTTVNNYNSGILIINMATSETNIDVALSEIKKVVNLLIQNGVDDKIIKSEVVKAKISYISASEQSITLAGSNHLDLIQTGQILSSDTVLNELSSVTNTDIKMLANKIFHKKPCVLGIISQNKIDDYRFVID